MRNITPFIVSVLLLITLIGCGKAETREKISPDGGKAIVDASGKILSEEKLEPLEGYTYDDETGRFVNETTGIWYIVEDGYRVIPPEQYLDRAKAETIDGINIKDRPDDVWELKEVKEITIQPGDTLVGIINPYFMNEHFRMNYEWYAKQVLELNNITDPHFIKAGDNLKMPIYIDKGAIANQ